jgi:hypothetical protein
LLKLTLLRRPPDRIVGLGRFPRVDSRLGLSDRHPADDDGAFRDMCGWVLAFS